MKDAAEILKLPTIEDARSYVRIKVNEHVAAHPQTRKENITKIDQIIARNSTIEKLSFAIANWVLAHPSEGLAVLKTSKYSD